MCNLGGVSACVRVGGASGWRKKRGGEEGDGCLVRADNLRETKSARRAIASSRFAMKKINRGGRARGCASYARARARARLCDASSFAPGNAVCHVAPEAGLHFAGLALSSAVSVAQSTRVRLISEKEGGMSVIERKQRRQASILTTIMSDTGDDGTGSAIVLSDAKRQRYLRNAV